MPVEEKALVEAILAGDESAKETLYHQNYRKLYVTAAHFLGGGDPEIEDLVQDTFVKAFTALDEFRFQASLSTWLNHICVNLCFDRLRRRKRQLAVEEEDLHALVDRLSREAHQRESAHDDTRGRAELVRKHLADMGDPCRGILERREILDQPYAQISEEMKIPIGTVMSRLSRCRDNLRKRIEEALKGVS